MELYDRYRKYGEECAQDADAKIKTEKIMLKESHSETFNKKESKSKRRLDLKDPNTYFFHDPLLCLLADCRIIVIL